MTVYILPTVSPVKYRGKYPGRARYISGTAGRGMGRHIELNDGTRLWSATDRTAEFSCGRLADDYSAIKAAATPMTADQYEVMKEAAELSRTIKDYAGHTKRAEIEARVRRLLLSISAPTVPARPATVEPEAAAPVRRDNVEYHNGKAARRAGEPETAFPYLAGGERAARWTLGWNEGAPAVQTIDMTPTWAEILPALLAALTDGTPEGQGIARTELARMATIADSYVAAQKALRDAS